MQNIYEKINALNALEPQADGTLHYLGAPLGTGGGASSLNALNDTDVSAASDGQILKRISGIWSADDPPAPGATTLNELSDTSVASAAEGQILQKQGGIWQGTDMPSGGGASSLNELNDTDVSTASDGQILKRISGVWRADDPPAPGATALHELSDTDVSTVSDGQVLRRVGSLWKGAYMPVGASELQDLSDIDIVNAADGQILKRDNGLWKAQHPASHYAVCAQNQSSPQTFAANTPTVLANFDPARVHDPSNSFNPVVGTYTARVDMSVMIKVTFAMQDAALWGIHIALSCNGPTVDFHDFRHYAGQALMSSILKTASLAYANVKAGDTLQIKVIPYSQTVQSEANLLNHANYNLIAVI